MMEETERAQTRQPISELGLDIIKVLHVEDDPAFREAIADELSNHGFVVQSFADAISLVDALAVSSEADIILLDWDLPKVSGIELLVELRQAGLNLPVVFLTGYAFVRHEHLAFERGAVDFIDKVRGVEILAGRLRRLARPPKSVAAPPPASLVVCGKLVLNSNVSRAYWNNFDVDLTLVEYNIVQHLVSNAGRWVTYRAIYDRVHYEGFVGGSGPDGSGLRDPLNFGQSHFDPIAGSGRPPKATPGGSGDSCVCYRAWVCKLAFQAPKNSDQSLTGPKLL